VYPPGSKREWISVGRSFAYFQRLVFGLCHLPTHPQGLAQTLAPYVLFLTKFQYTLSEPVYWHIDCNVTRFFAQYSKFKFTFPLLLTVNRHIIVVLQLIFCVPEPSIATSDSAPSIPGSHFLPSLVLSQAIRYQNPKLQRLIYSWTSSFQLLLPPIRFSVFQADNVCKI
jgi:hypothetical protein